LTSFYFEHLLRNKAGKQKYMQKETAIRKEMEESLLNGILKKWYPLVLDDECGGYFTNVTHDWKIAPHQEKMVVSQARHIWTLSKAGEYFTGMQEYKHMARHGFSFLKNGMWDKEYGGFFQIRSRDGGKSNVNGWRDEKRTYGNGFAVYGLAALYKLTHDSEVMEFVQTAFRWIEEHAYDSQHKGYFQFLTQEGKHFDHTSAYKTIAKDGNELGFKDQNSSIHLLEAFTEVYHVWKDPLVRTRLQELLTLIRDTEVAPQGYLQLFFKNDWTPISYRNSSQKEREANFGLDHVSFGHDYETAFLMLEASYALQLENDIRTLTIAKKLLDHAMKYGWDYQVGGFYDRGYYFKGDNHCTIIKDTKNWWAQAEGLNTLLLFAKIFPQETRYYEYFLQQWKYIQSFVIDAQGGDWFEGGIDKEPHFRTGLKSHMWKCTYHTGRALMNCCSILQEDPSKEVNQFIEHWRITADCLQKRKPADFLQIPAASSMS
jgi:cellobiose epimerase